MKRQAFQHPELRDANDNIIQEGTYGKESPLVNSDNTGVLDYINNNLMYLYNNTMGGTGGEINTETITGKTGTITNLTATTVKAGTLTADALNGPLTGNVTGDLNGNVTGDVTGNLTGNVTGTADKAVADAAGNDIQATYAKKSDISTSVSTNALTVSGETSVPTANAGNSSKAIANTKFVQGELTNYLPLSGGTMTGSIQYVENGKVFAIENTDPGNVDLGWNWVNREGAVIGLKSADNLKNPGEFSLFARDSANSCTLNGKPDGTLTWNSQPLLPVGVVQAFAGTTIPSGWLLCDGSAVSRTTYASLYACIGTTYGTGNGSTTFNLPNLTDRFIQGNSTSGSVKAAGLPNIKGEIGFRAFAEDNLMTINGLTPKAFSFIQGNGATFGWKIDRVTNSNNQKCDTLYFNANSSNSIYNDSVTTVQPPSVTMRYIIKY